MATEKLIACEAQMPLGNRLYSNRRFLGEHSNGRDPRRTYAADIPTDPFPRARAQKLINPEGKKLESTEENFLENFSG